ncbi:MAG TPA: TonB-dependent receptor plug domain-containing protein [Chitinophagaceae bacterium]|nr:TonB-dependent receptor plug domain-containing protein [Chitinophagaceae bacterium]
MRKTATCLLFSMAIYHISNSQNAAIDSSQTLGEVTVKAYEQNQNLRKVPAAINKINKSGLERFSNTNILPALNSTPGVRMEERSPGSYRMNIRGSTLRSPFGVRNVKVYWDEIPFTDPGGNTYLNQFGYYNFNSIEIIKGPAGSLYGAGTGGAILINGTVANPEPGLMVNLSYGSYDHSNINVQFNQGKDNFKNVFTYSHQQSDGYRNHTSMRRDVTTWKTQISAGKKESLHFNFLYGDLFYETPGALTKAEYKKDPTASRPAAGAFPSADGAKAAIYQKTWFGGFNNHYKFNEHFENSLIFYGAYSKIKNPTFRNYEARNEPHFGGRTVFTWKPSTVNDKVRIIFGAEAQKGYFNIHTYQNSNGKPTTTLTNDDVRNGIWSIFAQADLRLKYDINVTAGLSINKSSIKIKRLSIPALPEQKRSYKNEAAPRLAVSKKIVADLYLYASAAKGFSPPTVAEVLPSTSVISTELNAEHGISYEAGLKSSWLQRRLYAEVNAFDYRLKDAIVQRRDASNGDYFLNAGSTKQRGIESQVSYLFLQRNSFVNSARIWVSYTWNNFTYSEFKQLTNDYSGKKLPSVAKNTVASGFDISSRPGIYINLTYYYSDPIPLNDANIEFASSYNLLGTRIGWRKDLTKKCKLELFAGIDNAFDVTYSLGNDINAAGGRYYNAAPGRNYYGGVSLGLF